MLQVGSIHISSSYTKARQNYIKHLLGPGIGRPYRYDMVAALHIGEHTGKDGRCPAAEYQAIFGTIEGREFFTQDIHGRVEPAAVEIAAHFIFKGFPQVGY